jgi:hypothetical protein
MQVNRETGEAGQVRPFADVLRDLGKGHVSDEMSVMLNELVQAVRDYGRKGTLTLTVDVMPVKGNTEMLAVAAQVTSKPPKSDPVSAIFYATSEGNLVRDDPRQMDLPLREVASADARLGQA